MKRILISFTILIAGAAFATNYECKSDSETRTIEVKAKQAGSPVPCEVVYTKAGSSKVLWSAQAEEGYCEGRARAFAEQLEATGFACTEIEPKAN